MRPPLVILPEDHRPPPGTGLVFTVIAGLAIWAVVAIVFTAIWRGVVG